MYIVDKVLALAIIVVIVKSENYNSTIFQKVDSLTFTHLYLKNVQEAKVFCRFREISFNMELENYDIIRDKILLLTAELRANCGGSELENSCNHLADDILSLIRASDNKNKIIESLRGPESHLKNQEQPANVSLTHRGLTGIIQSLNSIKIESTKTRSYEQINRDLRDVLTHLQRYVSLNDLILQIVLQTNYQSIIELTSHEALIDIFHTTNAVARAESCQLPKSEGVMDIIRILKASTVRTEIFDNKFLLTLQFITIREQKFNLFQIISLPFTLNNSSFTLTPLSPYYLINVNHTLDKTSIYALSVEEKLNCKIINDLICFPGQPMKTFHEIKNDKHKI